METKEMTLQEAQEFLECTKFICESKEERDSVLSKLRALGVGVIDTTKSNSAYMFTIDNDNYLRSTISVVDWIEDKDKVIEPSEILAIQIKEPKPKFDPNTLQPFDKVLVRQNEESIWIARFYEYSDNVDFHVTNGSAWQYCIPYNDDTKHLHRTCDEAPEFYRLD